MKSLIITIGGLYIFVLNIYASDEPRLTILMYHGISEHCAAAIYEKRKDSFYADMEYIQEHFDVVALADIKDIIEKKKTLSRHSVVITFDDGFTSNYNLAVPILEEFGFKATFFIITDRCGEDGFMTWEQIIDLSRRKDDNGISLFDIGSHSCSHPDLGSFSEEQLRYELGNSKNIIERHIEKPCISFAIPYGIRSGDPILMNLAKNLGYENIRTSNRDNVDIENANLLDLPSLPLYDFTPPEYIGAFNHNPTLEMPYFDPVQDIYTKYNPLIDSYTIQANIAGILTYTGTGNDFISIEATPEDAGTVEGVYVDYTPPQAEGSIYITTKPGFYDRIRINVRVNEQVSHYSYGYFYIYFQTSGITGERDNINESMFIYPNPVTDWLEIKHVGELPLYKVYNSSGQTVLAGQNRRLNVAELPAGVYIINVYSGDMNIRFKFVKVQK